MLRWLAVVLLLRWLAVVMVMVVVARVEVREAEVATHHTKGFSLRQQFAELGVQFQQAKLRH